MQYKTIKLSYFVFFLLILFGIVKHIYNVSKPEAARFIIKNETIYNNHTLLFESVLIPSSSNLLMAHSASLIKLANGELLAFFFAGSKEGNPDVKIYQAKFNGKIWTKAKEIITSLMITEDTKRYTRKIGNPVAYLSEDGKLHLFVVSVGIGGWSGSSMNHLISTNNGNSWNLAIRLILSPFLNISTLGRTNAIALTDGGFYLPVYHELIRTYPELLRFDKTGKFINKIRITNHNTLLQPALLPITSQNAFVYMRNNNKIDKIIYYQKTYNGGQTWSAVRPTNLTNPDSSLVVTRINNNQYLMVHNIINRNKLALAISNDGVTWRDFYLLENTLNAEFSYPAITFNHGVVDILYTWKRLKIKHVRFNLFWLDNQIKAGDKID